MSHTATLSHKLIGHSANFLTDVEYLSPLGMSDHSVLKFSLQMFVDRVSADDKFRWDKGDYGNLCKLLDINWEDFLDATVDEMWENFKHTVIDGMNLFIPRGNQRLKRSNNKNSSGDEIANVNFLRRYGTYVLKNTKKENLLRLTN